MQTGKSTIPSEICALGLPNIEKTIVIGGAAMELLGLRTAEDIDLVVSLENWRYLRDQKGWNVHRKPDGRSFLADSTGRFDVWRWWFDPASGQRVTLAELVPQCHTTPSGFYVPSVTLQIELKEQLAREKDAQDIEKLRQIGKGR